MANADDETAAEARGGAGKAPLPRTAKQIIDQAIKENKVNEKLLYGFAIVFVLVGTVGMGYGMYHGEGLMTFLSLLANVLFYPAMKMAREIRRENIAIRLVENPPKHGP